MTTNNNERPLSPHDADGCDNDGADGEHRQYRSVDEQEDDESCGEVPGAHRGGEGDEGDEGVAEQAEASLAPAPNNKPSASPSDGSHAPPMPTIPTGTGTAVVGTSSDLRSIDDLHARSEENTERCASSGRGQLSERYLNASSSIESHPQPPGGEDADNLPSIFSSRGFQLKERPICGRENEVGAVQVDEQAPSLNRLFFRGRRSLLIRQRAWREPRRLERSDDNGEMAQRQSETGSAVEEQDAHDATVVQDENTTTAIRRVSEYIRVRFSGLLQATLVADVEEGEVFEAEPVGLFERNWKIFASAAGALLLALLAISVIVFYVSQNGNSEEGGATPTSSPTFDPRPTLEIVQERGHVLCGMSAKTIESGEGFYIELCRSVAAVVLGNPDSFVGVPVTGVSRWRNLLDRKVDLLVYGDTHTFEREIREKSTGSGFAFSTPYNYDGMIFTGNETLVRCAEGFKRYGECLSLKICVQRSSTHYDFLAQAFPPTSLAFGSTFEGRADMLFNGTCNVIAADKSQIRWSELVHNAIRDGKYIRGEKTMTKEPLAMVTRNTDREFSDIVNWVLQALLIGQEQGLIKDLSLCQNHTDLTSHDASELVFMNAVYCVGNYMEIFDDDPNEWKMNQINRGTGMLYSIPFGNVENGAGAEPAAHSLTLEKIKNEGFFTCGVTVPDDFEGDITRSDNLVGMSVDYCRTLSAAMFIGDSERVHFLNFTNTDNSSVVALANGTLDVLVGGRNQQEFDFGTSASPRGLSFSTPYYYGNESASDGVGFYSMATREDDVLFASFVNCVVMATIHAQENDIQKHKSREMPLISIFGSNSSWALRDAISYSGSYDEIYARNFGSGVAKSARGRNTLNDGGPLMLPFLNLSKL